MVYISMTCDLKVVCSSFVCLLSRRPPESTRNDTLFPYTTLFRSIADRVPELFGDRPRMFDREIGDAAPGIEPVRRGKGLRRTRILTRPATAAVIAPRRAWHEVERRIDRADEQPAAMRTEERSIGKECVSTWRSRRGRYT